MSLDQDNNDRLNLSQTMTVQDSHLLCNSDTHQPRIQVANVGYYLTLFFYSKSIFICGSLPAADQTADTLAASALPQRPVLH